MRISVNSGFVQAIILAGVVNTATFSSIALAQEPTKATETATEADMSQSQQYTISAGPLSRVLSEFAAQAGILLSVDGQLTQGKDSAGLTGKYSVSQALRTLLDGTGLASRLGGSGTWTLEQAEAQQDSGPVRLEPIAVIGSYTTSYTGNATGLNMSLRETPQSVIVITRQQIDDRASTEIADILEHSIGISINRAETDRVFPTARGFEITNIQIDGALIGNAAASVESDFLGDTAIYERVEIIRGAAGMLVGAGTPSAAINLVRKRPTTDLAASISAKVGRWNLARVETDISGALGFDDKLRGRFVAAGQSNESHLNFLEQEKIVLYGIIEADLSPNTLLTFGLDYQKHHTDGVSFGETVPLFYTDGGRTDLPRSTTTGADWTFRNRDRSIVFTSLKHEFDNGWSASIDGSYLEGEYDDERIYTWGTIDRNTGEGLEGGPSKTHGERIQSSIDLRLKGPFSLLGREHDLVLGWNNSVDKNDRKRWAAASQPPLGNFFEQNIPYPGFTSETDMIWGWEVKQSGVYATSRFSISEPLTVIVGARSSNYDVVEHFQNEVYLDVSDNNIITPYIGTIYDINNNFSAYASYTEIFQLQTEKDRNNDLLPPVEGANYEVGIKAEFFEGRLNANVAVFEVQQENIAVFDTVVMVNGVPEDRFKTEEGITTKGYEMELHGELLPGLQMYAGYAHRKAKNSAGEETTRQAPRDMLRLSGSYDLSNHVTGLTLGGAMRWQSAIYPRSPTAFGPNGDLAVQKSYTLADIFVRYQLTHHLSAQLNIHNLFDKKYYSSVGQYVVNGHYGQPRNISASMQYNF